MKKASMFLGVVAFLTVLLALGGSPGWAVDFTGNSAGVFSNPTGPGGMVTTGVGSSDFTWGVGSPPSSLSFTGAAFSGDFETTVFNFGTLSYYNGTIAAGTEANTVDLATTLTFTLPSIGPQTFNFTFTLINTPNTTDPVASADYVQFGQAWDPTKTFSWNGVSYTLNFTGFGNISQGGFAPQNDQFHVYEGQSATADLFGKITANPSGVPEPFTLLFLGAALVGAAGLGRKLKR